MSTLAAPAQPAARRAIDPSREAAALAARLSLRPPQREALAILDRAVALLPMRKESDLPAALAALRTEFPQLAGFERDFPSLCFALATGVGKTRLMGACIAYLHVAHGIDDFFVLAPNLTIYRKLIADFTPNTPKYVFQGVAAFATQAPEIITGDDYAQRAGTLFDQLIRCKINIFNIGKINAEVRGGSAPRIKKLSEYLGESYFDYLAGRDRLVLLMDESHRYRASAGVRAINELKPILGLELTATPFVTAGGKTTQFRNVVLDYPLRRAMDDGFVKEPTVATRERFDPSGMTPEELERLKLEDGVRLHEITKVELETYARARGLPVVKPFVLVIARDTTHAAELLATIRSDGFFAGRYAGKAIQVDSSGSGVEKDETIERLLRVESPDEPTEIVIHVNMLKEGWDVTNLYTIVPLRAASARVLIEQTIGRGLRLPYGKRTGVEAVDRLTIVAHDKFQEIVEEARKPDSPIQLKTLVLDPADLSRPRVVVAAPSAAEVALGLAPAPAALPATVPGSIVVPTPAPVFATPREVAVARIAHDAIERYARKPDLAPSVEALTTPAVQARIVAEVRAVYDAGQIAMDGIAESVDIEAVVERVAQVVVDGTISIPRIAVVPVGEHRVRFDWFTPDLSSIAYPAPSEALHLQSLRTNEGAIVGLAPAGIRESRLEDYIVAGLIDFDDVDYDANAVLLQDLASGVVAHLRGYLADDGEVEAVLRAHQRPIATLLHVQIVRHERTADVEWETIVSGGFAPIQTAHYDADAPLRDPKLAPPAGSSYGTCVYAGYARCLQSAVKFDSDPERVLALILDRDARRWARPGRGLFQITYRHGGEQDLYQPDFVAELEDELVIIEVKRRIELDDPVVIAKRDAAVVWCGQATRHAARHGGKPWSYALIPHDAIAENWTAQDLLARWRVSPPTG